MNILDIIEKKRYKKHLTYEELAYAFNGYLKKEIPDYQMSALLMAITINELDEEEIFSLTDIFLKSGEIIDLSNLDGLFVDKHSTGGVGDKTTLVIGPIIASCGLKMPKMSGRGLGLTGGTIDKLESIPGFDVNLSDQEFIDNLNKVGYVNVSQNDNLVPLDKVIYALRDVTGTTTSLGLIAVSIMSKKIAGGASCILIDVKYGNGALIKTKEQAEQFSLLVKKIGHKYNKKVETKIDNMDIPLGNNIGNALEILEVIDILKGKKGYLTNLCLELASILISMAKDIDLEKACKLAQEALESGKAYNKFLEFVSAQKGDISKIKISPYTIEVKSHQEGYLKDINAHEIAKLASKLGCNRQNKNDIIDYSVGIVIHKNINDYVKKEENLCTLYVKNPNIKIDEECLKCFKIEGGKV